MDKSSEPISNAEFYRNYEYQSKRITGIEDHLLEIKNDFKEQLNRIEVIVKEGLAQGKRTNGNVTDLQIWRASLKAGWQSGTWVFGGCIVLIIGLISFVFVNLSSAEISTQTQLDKFITQTALNK